MKSHSLNLVVTCTKRKTTVAPYSRQLGHLAGTSLRDVSKRWIQRLKGGECPPVSAEGLYAGDHWQIARSLADLGKQRRLAIRLWVCSAGYGLIRATAPLQSYSATFSRTHPDSVLTVVNRLGVSVTEWWETLASWEGPEPGQPRTLSELARQQPRTPLMLVASAIYCDALAADLEQARLSLHDPELLLIVSGGGRLRGNIQHHQLPCDARLQPILGGALMSLNIRTAARIVAEYPRWPLQLKSLRQHLTNVLAELPPPPVYNRRSTSDEEVQQFILEQLLADPEASHTRLLRRFRREDRACEQKRFRKCFEQVQGEVRG